MSVKAILFDLDGTLLPMDQEVFVKTYFGGISKKLSPRGYEPKEFIGAIWKGTGAMIKNNGIKTNEEVFWDVFRSIYDEKCMEDIPYFDAFYEEDFDSIKDVCGYTPEAAELINFLKSENIRLILATNPIFPSIATEKRISWAGLHSDDFEFFTSYENCVYSKPNLDYYKDILNRIGLSADECIMVGNDVDDDMVVTQLGMQAFLLTDCLINKNNTDISSYPNGDFKALKAFLTSKIK